MDKELTKILKKFNVVYFLILTLLFLVFSIFLILNNYQNKVRVAENISSIVEGKLKNNNLRDVLKVLSTAQLNDFRAVSYYNSDNKRILTFPSSVKPTYFEEKSLIDDLLFFTINTNIYYDLNHSNKVGTLKFSIFPYESIFTASLFWFIFSLGIYPIAEHYKKLIVKSFDKKKLESKIQTIKEIQDQVQHDSRGAIQAIKAVMDSNEHLDALERKALHSATYRLESMLSVGGINDQYKYKLSETNQLIHISSLFDDLINEKKVLYGRDVNISIDYEKGTDACYMRINEVDLKRIISNIIDNSSDAIKAKESLISQNGIISLSVQKNKNMLNIVVLDNGIGIKESDLNSIGKKGFSLKSSGCGLGLSWAVQKINEWNGEFKVNSIYKGYTSILISLPTYSV